MQSQVVQLAVEQRSDISKLTEKLAASRAAGRLLESQLSTAKVWGYSRVLYRGHTPGPSVWISAKLLEDTLKKSVGVSVMGKHPGLRV